MPVGEFDREYNEREHQVYRQDECCHIDPVRNLCPAFESCTRLSNRPSSPSNGKGTITVGPVGSWTGQATCVIASQGHTKAPRYN